MAAVMIGVDPHKASHTAVVISAAEEPLGELRVRACVAQAERLLAWAAAWPQRTWAVEGAGGTGHLLAQQLVSAGERVLDVQPKLGARVRLLAAGDVNKNDPNDARSVAVAALRSAGVREVRADDHAAVLKIWSKRYRDLGRTRTQVVCRLHAVLGELIPGGVPKAITAARAARVLRAIRPDGAVQAARCELAAALPRGPAPHRRPDPRDQEEARGRRRRGRDQPDRAVRGRPGHRRRCHRRCPRRVPVPRPGPLRRLQRDRADRGVLRPAQGLPAVAGAGTGGSTTPSTWPRSPRSATGTARAAPTTTRNWPRARPRKEALRALKRQVSNAIFACLQADARRAAARAGGPGGQQGNDSVASAAGSHPRHRLFGQATPGPGHHPTTAAGSPAPGPARARGRAGHSSIAATLPPAKPQVQVERPQRSEDERPGGAARRRPHSAARKARDR